MKKVNGIVRDRLMKSIPFFGQNMTDRQFIRHYLAEKARQRDVDTEELYRDDYEFDRYTTYEL